MTPTREQLIEEIAGKLWLDLCEGDGQHSESLDKALIRKHLDRLAACLAAPPQAETNQYAREFWLGEHGRPGIPLALMDGPHDDRAGVERAAYLIPALGLGKPSRPFVCVEAIVTPVTPSAEGVDHGAVAQNRSVIEKARRPPQAETKGDE